jgi:ribosomal protein L37AE/L43A
MIEFSCPYCNRPMRASDETAGRTGKCKSCNNTVTVPQSKPGAEINRDGGTIRPIVAASSQTHHPPAQPSQNRPQKACPFCGEYILAIAKKCKHCGEMLDDASSSPRQTESQRVSASANETRETFWQFVWRISKHPLAHSADPLVQSAAAFGINLWCLVIAVLAQFWVILSAVILLAQTYNTWLVAKGRMRKGKALFVGLLLVSINVVALSLAVLGQFWVFASAALAVWQYVSLIRVCFTRRQLHDSMPASRA